MDNNIPRSIVVDGTTYNISVHSIDGNSWGWICIVDDLRGCGTQATTLDELMDNTRDAITEYNKAQAGNLHGNITEKQYEVIKAILKEIRKQIGHTINQEVDVTSLWKKREKLQGRTIVPLDCFYVEDNLCIIFRCNESDVVGQKLEDWQVVSTSVEDAANVIARYVHYLL